MFDYMTVKEAAMKYASVWGIPKDVEKPKDERIVTGKTLRSKYFFPTKKQTHIST